MDERINVSVIMATYNRGRIIEDVLDCWDRIREYTKYSFEILCSDDASEDDTAEKIEKRKGLPITLIRNPHGGAARARNAAFQMARGEIVIFTGDDMFPEPDFIDRHYENYLRFGPKIGTLGRIYWHPDIGMNPLMYHITNVGCEQFGFAKLTPRTLTDYRSFYTSNISVSMEMLKQLEFLFDTSFDRYGFEDIELGYRLEKLGYRIYYDPRIKVFHHHIYDDTEKFCVRQRNAGSQMAVFAKLHPELKKDPSNGIESFEAYVKKEYKEIEGNETERAEREISGEKVLQEITELTEEIRQMERRVAEEDTRELRARLSGGYQFLFQFEMYMGWAERLLAEKSASEAMIAAMVSPCVVADAVQIFRNIGSGYSEAESETVARRGRRFSYRTELTDVKRLRIDPGIAPCKLTGVGFWITDKNGKKKKLHIRSTNGKGLHGFDFYDQADPQIHLSPFGMKGARELSVTLEFEDPGIQRQIETLCHRELEIHRDYLHETDLPRDPEEEYAPDEEMPDCGKVSVIIPCYNHEAYVKQAVESVLNQTYPDIEVIVVDDGSGDRSAELVEEFRDERVKLIRQENRGAHEAINRGLKEATGAYLAILNSDDTFAPSRVETMLREMGDAKFACSYIQLMDGEGRKLGVKQGFRNMLPWEVPEEAGGLSGLTEREAFLWNLCLTNFTSTTGNFLFAREVYDSVGGMRKLRFAHDWDYALRVADTFSCKVIDSPLLSYRVHGDNTISKDRSWMLAEVAAIWAIHGSKFKGDPSTMDAMSEKLGNTEELRLCREFLAGHTEEELLEEVWKTNISEK